MNKKLLALGTVIVLEGIRPKHIAHQAVRRRLPESVKLVDVFKLAPIGRNTTVDTNKLLIDCRGKGKSAKRLEDGFVEFFRVLVDA